MKIFLLTLLVFSQAGATAYSQTIPNVWGEWSWPYTDPVHVVVSPSGGGPPLTSAEYMGGAVIDATIRVQLWVQDNPIDEPFHAAPVANFPGEDIWLEFPGPYGCMGGMNADGSTDANGWFTFSGALGLGGWNDPADPLSFPHVMVNGTVLSDENFLPIRPTLVVNSPDINGDLEVNLGDVSQFAEDYYGPYAFRSDFFWDGVLSLTDIVWMAQFYGDACP